MINLPRPCYRVRYVGNALAACLGSCEPRVEAGRGGDGPLPDVRARARGWRRGNRGACPDRCTGTRGYAYGLHGLARRAARGSCRAGREGATDLFRRAPSVRSTRRALPSRPRARSRNIESLAWSAPLRTPGGRCGSAWSIRRRARRRAP